jgi:tRNA A37 N6-isopentenylltransferase MiaA
VSELVVLLLLLVVIGGGAALYRRHSVQQREAAERAELESVLTTSRRAADEDVTKFGEELQRLDSDVAGHALDEPMQQD